MCFWWNRLVSRAYMCEWVKEEKIETQVHTGCSFISASYFELLATITRCQCVCLLQFFLFLM
jgi:hypothetical protein